MGRTGGTADADIRLKFRPYSETGGQTLDMQVPRAIRLVLLVLAMLLCVEVSLYSLGWVQYDVDGTAQNELTTTAQSLTHSIARGADGALRASLAAGDQPGAKPCPT